MTVDVTLIRQIMAQTRKRLDNIRGDLDAIDAALGAPAPVPPPVQPPPVSPPELPAYLLTPEGTKFRDLLYNADRWRWPFDPRVEPADTLPAFPSNAWHYVSGFDFAGQNWFLSHQNDLPRDVFNRPNEWAGWNSWVQYHYVTT